MRSTLFLNLEKYFNDNYTYLIHGAFSSRNKENSYVAGASVSLPILSNYDHDRRLYLGCFYRINNAYIPSVNIMMGDYSTWKGQRMYLEDILVTEDMRGQKIGSQLFDALIAEAKEKGFKGIHWQVLDWNEPAINFYKKYQANFDPEWINCSIVL